MKTLGSLLIAAVFATLTFAVWAYLNRPTREPPWPARIQGFAFSPFRANEDPSHGQMPTDAEIDSDLTLLEGKVNAVRTYSVEKTLADVPDLAERHDLNVALGAWLDSHHDHNEQQLQTAIELANTHQNVVRVIIGNEVIFRGDLPVEELEKYLDRARAAIGQPVGTAETWHVWLAHPELAQHVDFIGVHLLPYWEGVGVDEAVDYSLAQLQAPAEDLPAQADRHRRDRLAEPRPHARVGGRLRCQRGAVPAPLPASRRAGADRLLRDGGLRSALEGRTRRARSAPTGACTTSTATRSSNSPRRSCAYRSGTCSPRSRWRWRCWCSGCSISTASTLRNRGRSFLAVVVYAAATLAVWVFYDFTQQYMTVSSVIAGVLLLLGMLGVMLVLLAEAHEWAEAHWVTYRRRLGRPGAHARASAHRRSRCTCRPTTSRRRCSSRRSMRSRASTIRTSKCW